MTIEPPAAGTSASRAARHFLARLPEDASVWAASAELIDMAGPQTEGGRMARTLGIQPDDYRDWAAEQDRPDAERFDPTRLNVAMRRDHAAGFSTADILRMIVDGTGPFTALGNSIAVDWGIGVDRAADAHRWVRAITVAALCSATAEPSDARAQHPAFADQIPAPPEYAGIIVPSSFGLMRVLKRAEGNRRHTTLPVITSAGLLRAVLPHWATPDATGFLRGLGLDLSISSPWGLEKFPEAGRAEIMLNAAPDTFALSEPAWRTMIVAASLRDVAQSAMTLDHILLGLLATPGTYLHEYTRSAVGSGVNLPLLYLQTARGGGVSPAEAELAISLGDAQTGDVPVLEDLPSVVIREIVRGLDESFSRLPQSWSGRNRAARALARHEIQRGEFTADPAQADDAALTMFLRTGHVGSLRSYAVSLPARDFDETTGFVRFLLGEQRGLSREELKRLADQMPTDGPLMALSASTPPSPAVRYGATVAMLCCQDWNSADLRVAPGLGSEAIDAATEAAKSGDYVLAASWTMLQARLDVRAFRAHQGLPSGTVGSNLPLIAADLDDGSGTVVTVFIGAGHALAISLGTPARAAMRRVAHDDLTRWWKAYRTACLSHGRTHSLLEDLAALTGITSVLSGAPPTGPVRVCVAGDYTGLPLAQAIAVILPDRGIPVITHLAGGPFRDLLANGRVPRGLLAGKVAVVSPPPVHGVSELPFAEEEAAAVRAIHGARYNLDKLAANKAGVLRLMRLNDPAHRPLVWHFATHGSMTVTAAGQVTAGILLLDHEMLVTIDIGRYVREGIVFCSACDVGGLPPSPQVPSWPFAALAGGAHYVIAATRPVSDPITLITMLRTHEIWAQHEVRVWEALTMAQQWTDDAPLSDVQALLQRHQVDDKRHWQVLQAFSADRSTGELGNQWAFGTSTR